MGKVWIRPCSTAPRTRRFTSRSKVNGQPVSAGSGFVVKVLSDKLLVMTNRHVAVDDDEPAGAKREIFVVFRSQTPQEQELPAKLLTFDHRYAPDLAMLEVKGVRQPPTEIPGRRRP